MSGELIDIKDQQMMDSWRNLSIASFERPDAALMMLNNALSVEGYGYALVAFSFITRLQYLLANQMLGPEAKRQLLTGLWQANAEVLAQLSAPKLYVGSERMWNRG
jgi:hypothetical protein